MTFDKRHILGFVAIVIVVAGIGLGEILSNAAKIYVDAAHKVVPWTPETVKTFAELPVQEDGRNKPLETLASVRLLAFHGTRTLRLKYSDQSSRSLTPTEWLLDTLFYPEHARFYPIFVVDDPAAVEMIGMKAHEARRQRYSYAEIEPVREALEAKARELSAIKAQDREAKQGMIVALEENVQSYERLLHALDWARNGLQLPANAETPPLLASAVKDGRLPLSRFVKVLREAGGALSPDDVPENVREIGMKAAVVGLYPMPDKERKEWMNMGQAIFGGLISPTMQEKCEKVLGDWEDLASKRDDRAAFQAKASAISDEIRSAAEARGELRRPKWELIYNKADLFYRSLVLLLVAFVCQAVTWIKQPNTRSTWALHVGTWVCLGLAMLAIGTGMALRTVVMDRAITAPMTNLYETILFITFIVIALGMAAELFTRRKLALPLTAFLASVGMFIAMRYEATEGGDQFRPLQAVLNTNYWLSIHVTSINIGYAGGLLAAVFAGVYLVALLLDPLKKDADFFKTLTICVYGIDCFGLLFALVGTILGGLWANESWGRFWGWDPKENGALMIVLAFLIVLHARLGGYIREFGLHMLTLLTGAVVVFSWFHVNLLGVGLHSYGFTAGIKKAVYAFYGVIALVAALGFLARIQSRIAMKGVKDRLLHRKDITTPGLGSEESYSA